jgi:hypothetical protein
VGGSDDRFDDPFYQPPADIQGEEARRYENAILRLLRHAMLPSASPVVTLVAIELRGERPDTEVVYIYTDAREPGRRFAQSTQLWKGIYHWAVNEPPDDDLLNEAASVGGAFSAHECDPIEVPCPEELRSATSQ